MASFISTYLIGPALPLFLIAAGLYLNIKLGFLPFTQGKAIFQTLIEKAKPGGVSPRKALCLALAGTLGVGNIVGVATAIRAGGAGAIFWMWVSAIFAMTIKYAETVLALRHRKVVSPRYVRDFQGKDDILSADEELSGGAMYFIKNNKIACLFAVICLLSSFTVGNLIQINAVSSSFAEVFGMPHLVTGILLAILTFFIITKGAVFVSSFCAWVIPLISLLYILMSSWIMVKNASALPGVFSRIFREAFAWKAAAGGIGASLFLRSLRVGFSRGLITNEAGCGTAPIAHAAARTNDPVRQGFLGIIEVFFDTVILCSLTAFVVLLVMDRYPDLDGMALVHAAFRETFGQAAGYLLAVSIFLFVIATLIGWSFYGKAALRFLTSRRYAPILYCFLFSLTSLIGALGAPALFWTLSDITCAIMTFINTSKVIASADEIKEETQKHLAAARTPRKKGLSQRQRPSDTP